MADSIIFSLKGTFLSWEPTEEAGSSIWFWPLPWALERGGGPSVRPEACPFPRSMGGIPVLGWKFGLSKKFVWGREGLALDQRPDLFLLRIRGCHDLTPFLYHVRYFAHLLECLSQRRETYHQEGLYHNHYYYHFYYFEDLILELDLFPYH